MQSLSLTSITFIPVEVITRYRTTFEVCVSYVFLFVLLHLSRSSAGPALPGADPDVADHASRRTTGISYDLGGGGGTKQKRM